MVSEENLIWLDLEMTGLDVSKEKILEFACVVTDKDLSILAKGPNYPIKVNDEILSQMDDWNKTHHTSSGLISDVKSKGIELEELEGLVIGFLKQYCIESKAIMAGIGIYRDRQFIDSQMPKLSKFLSYRMLDVSPLFQIQSRWYPDIKWKADNPAHRAMDDVIQSIEILKFFRKSIFK